MRRLPRWVSLAAAAVLTTSGALAALPATQASAASTTRDRATAAAAKFLTDELRSGVFEGSVVDGPDAIETSVEAAFALQSVGGQDAAVNSIRDGVARNIAAYVAARDARALATATVLAQVTSSDVANFGGRNLIQELRGRVSGYPETGRITDGTLESDTITQAYAARALANDPGSVAQASTSLTYLLIQQCWSGAFRASLGSQKGCNWGEGDVETTAQAVRQLGKIPNPSAEVLAAKTKAVSWLTSRNVQAGDGSFPAGSSLADTAGVTGLAGQVLAQEGKTSAAASAAAYVHAQQVADFKPCQSSPLGLNGAIAPSPSALASARAAAGDPDAMSKFRSTSRLSTALALPLLQTLPTSSSADLGLVAVPVGVGQALNVRVSGLGVGEKACLWTSGGWRSVVGTGSDQVITLWGTTSPASAAITLDTVSQSLSLPPGATTATPTAAPTANPTSAPTAAPTRTATAQPTVRPTTTGTSTSVTWAPKATSLPSTLPNSDVAVGTGAGSGKAAGVAFAPAKKKLTAKKRFVTVRLKCAKTSALGCQGAVQLTTKKGAVASSRAEYALSAGGRARVVVRLNATGAAKVRHKLAKLVLVQSRSGATSIKHKVTVHIR